MTGLILWQKLIRERLLPRPLRVRKPARIALFASLQQLGGATLISAIVKTLKELYPNATLYVVGEPHRAGKLEAFFKRHSWVDGFIPCPRRDSATFAEWWRFYRELKTYHFDLCVLSPNHSCANSVFLYLCGVPEIVGVHWPELWAWHGEVEHRFLTVKITEQLFDQVPGMLLQFPRAYARTLLGKPDLEMPMLVPYVRFTDTGLPAVLAHKPLVTMHPGGPPRKRWPATRFAAIGRLLIQQYDAAICIVGGEPEREVAEEIKGNIARECPGGTVVNRCGASLDQTMTYIAHSSMFLGNGAGPMQFAMALGIPVVAVFPKSEYLFAAPLSAGSQHRALTNERVEDVLVSDVWAAIQSQGRLGQPRFRASAV